MSLFKLTNGDTSMRPTEVGVGLRDGAHPDLIIGPTQEASKCAYESYVPVAGGTADGNANHVLFSNEALDETVVESFTEGVSIGGVFGITVQSYDVFVTLTNFFEASSVGHTSSHLQKYKNQMLNI